MSCCSRTKAPRSVRSRRSSKHGCFSSTSAEIVAELDDILIQILSLLPIKTLLRSKTVSKRWLSIITNPDFSNHFIKSNHPLPISGYFINIQQNGIKYSFVSLQKQIQPLPLPLRFNDHPTDMIIMQSTNGLLLCKCSCSTTQFNTSYYVYNPTTKQNTLLPRITDHFAISLAFDPSKSPHYKVFCLKKKSHLYHIEVYTSNEGPWRRLVSVPSFTLPPTIDSLNYSVFSNGAVHWFDYRSGEGVSFDINQEEIKIFPLPFLDYIDNEVTPDIGALRFLDESRGNLYSIEVNDLGSSMIPVYEMERGSSSWGLKYNVDLEPLAEAFPEMVRTQGYTDRRIYEFSILGFDAESYILIHIPNKAVKYNFIEKTFKKLCGFEALFNDEFQGFQTSFRFIESLANV